MLWLAGDLSFLMHAGQRRLRDQFHAWRKIDQIELTHEAGALPLVFAVKGGKRFGKTTCALWIAHEVAIWFAAKYGKPISMRYTSAFQKNIEEIVGSVAPTAFETAPPSCEPSYHGKRGPLPAGFYWPTQGPTLGARLALAGLDMNKNALRGLGNDLDFVSEAGFVDNLEYTVRNVLIHQYQQRPWARMMVETSAPEVLGTDWELTILPDAERRSACFSATIEDNSRLSRREKDFWIGQAGGRGHPNCEREYFNVIAGDPEIQCFPEFSRDTHVKHVEVPSHAVCITADDPGFRHLYGKVWAFYDFDNARLVVQDSWTGSNSSSSRAACVSAAREFDLWGTWPPTQMKSIPLDSDDEVIGWREYLKGDRCEELAEELHRMANVAARDRPDAEQRPGQWILSDIPHHLTYWDGVEHRKNPQARISDVDLRLIRDMDDLFGLEFMSTTKEELRVMVNLVRNWLGEGRLIFQPEAGPVIDHVAACLWDDKTRRKHFAEHRTYGHFDAASCIVYLVRYAQQIEKMRPYPPQRAAFEQGQHVVVRLPWQPRERFELELQRRIDEARRVRPARNMLRTR
jgi:hypothetical protein